MDISYIIPAHNCEKTIKRTIKSILNYNSSDRYEIIVVENGSTDNTFSVLNKLKNKYSVIKVFRSNKGVSKARNKGIDEAKGKWIWFVDADDRINFNIATKLDEYEDSDLIIGNYKINNKKINLVTKNRVLNQSQYDKFRLNMISNPTLYMTVWTKLFKLEIINKYHIRFNEELTVAEDGDFTFRYLMKGENIMLLSEYIYSYSTLASSTMRTANLKSVDDYIVSMNEMSNNICSKKVEISNAIYRYISTHFLISMVRGVFPSPDINFRDKVKLVKEIKNKDVYLNSFKKIKLDDIKKNKKLLPIFFLKYNLVLFPSIMFYVKAKFNNWREK